MATDWEMAWRFKGAAGLQERCTVIAGPDAAAIRRRVRSVRRELSVSLDFDLCALSDQEIVTQLRELPIPADEPIHVVHLSNRQVLAMAWETFAGYFSGLCYPASDDVVVAPMDLTWLIEVDHEEVLRFLRAADERRLPLGWVCGRSRVAGR